MSMTEAAVNERTAESPPTEGWVTLTEAAGEVGVTRDAIYQLIKTGRIAERDWKRGDVPASGGKSPYMVKRSALEQITQPSSRPYVRKAQAATSTSKQSLPNLAHHIAYVSGYLTAWTEMYARGQGVEVVALVAGVVEVMRGGR